MRHRELVKTFTLQLFSLFISFITYGFALTNYSLTVDSEGPAYSGYSMALGRWGTNLIRYRVFEGLLPYFTLLLGLIFLSLSAVELSRIFKLKGLYSYLFCALFLTLPQHAYQLGFTMQADAIPIGFFCSIIAVGYFIDFFDNDRKIYRVLKLCLSCLLIIFSIAINQVLVFIPVVTYIIYFFINLYKDEYILKEEIKKVVYFILLMAVSTALYYLSVKLFCPPMEGGYLSTYASGSSDNRLINFYNLWIDNIRGDFYYGNKTFIFVTISSLILLFFFFFIEKRNAVLKSLCVLALLIMPFVISFFITNGSHPPRLYVGSPIVFGFLIVHLFTKLKAVPVRPILVSTSIIVIMNIYFVTNLFYSVNRVYHHDLNIARNINGLIHSKYPRFNPNIHYVYFYGMLPESNYEKLILPKSDVFAGSLFRWDGGNNWRIINFFRVNDIGYYTFLNDRPTYNFVKDSIPAMPVWPNPESVKKINNVVVVKLGRTPGGELIFNN